MFQYLYSTQTMAPRAPELVSGELPCNHAPRFPMFIEKCLVGEEIEQLEDDLDQEDKACRASRRKVKEIEQKLANEMEMYQQQQVRSIAPFWQHRCGL